MLGLNGGDLFAADQRRHREKSLAKLPQHIAAAVAARADVLLGAAGHAAANEYLRAAADLTIGATLPLSASDDDLVDAAARFARRCWRYPHDAAALVARYLPDVDFPGAPRAGDAKWWRRKLRSAHGRYCEATAQAVGLVSAHTGRYCSDGALESRRAIATKTAAFLAACIAVADDGETVPLSVVAARSLSNPTLRRAELMVRVRGMETFAAVSFDQGAFVTLTCPARMHARLIGGGPNPSWDGTSPRSAQAYLQRQWGRARAALEYEHIRIYGLRVVEPHHDGTPHWHILLWSDTIDDALRVLRRYALQVDGDEPGAQDARFKAVRIDNAPRMRKGKLVTGSAAAYIAKYIAKSIDGYGGDLATTSGISGKGVERDLFGSDPNASAERVVAWARTWGIRQFQFFGGPPVGPWRELRRLRSGAPGIFSNAWTAADGGDWAAYMDAMISAPVTLAKVNQEGRNRYDEPKPPRVVGVCRGGVVALTRLRRWKITRDILRL
ncbi:MAG: replication endonuclease [Acidobacteriaceae bacterium]